MSKLTLEELQRMRERNRIVVELRDSDNKKAQIVVGMGTSGLAKGAKKVFNAFCDLVAEKGLVEVMVRQSGAMGHADLEPTVEVVAEGMEPVLYAHVTEAAAAEILEKHVLGRTVVEALRAQV